MEVEIDRIAPTVRPAGRPAGFQRWQHLAFLHWEIDPAEAQASLPEGLTLDTFEEKAWVGVVPFTMRDVSPWWSPSVPGVSNFHELNVRTYCVRDGIPGVWFYSLDAASSLAVTLARAGWGLPYHRARMRLALDGATVSYESERRWPGPTPARLSASYTIGAPLRRAAPGTFEHFLLERYVLYAVRGGRLLRGRVHHEPYPFCDLPPVEVEETMTAAAGLRRRGGAPIAHYSPGVDVDVYALEPVDD